MGLLSMAENAAFPSHGLIYFVRLVKDGVTVCEQGQSSPRGLGNLLMYTALTVFCSLQ